MSELGIGSLARSADYVGANSRLFSAAQTPHELTNAADTTPDGKQLREAFDSFVGETFYGQLLSAMRKTVDKSAYFHGGRAEEVFQGQMDQILAQKLTESTASQFTQPMFELFELHRS
jgi:flagellar protein FlgJ